MSKKNLKYSEAIEEVEEILSQMESNDLDVDDLSEKVKRVSFLLKLCKEKLYKTEKEVQEVLKNMEQE